MLWPITTRCTISASQSCRPSFHTEYRATAIAMREDDALQAMLAIISVAGVRVCRSLTRMHRSPFPGMGTIGGGAGEAIRLTIGFAVTPQRSAGSFPFPRVSPASRIARGPSSSTGIRCSSAVASTLNEPSSSGPYVLDDQAVTPRRLSADSRRACAGTDIQSTHPCPATLGRTRPIHVGPLAARR